MRRHARAALAALALIASPAVAQVAPQPTLEQIATVPAGKVGIAGIDITTGRELSVHGDQRFPLASTVKVALAAMFLQGVDQGRRSLTAMVPLDDRFRHDDGIAKLLPHPGLTLSMANWLEAMLTISDNSAADLVFDSLGGPAAVQRWMTAEHVDGMRADRDIASVLLDNIGVPRTPGASDLQSLRDAERLPALTPQAMDAAAARFDADPRDSTTPLAMARLLARIDRGDILKPASRGWLLAVMARTATGKDRIGGLLPKGTPVAHKTGTLHNSSDDVGIVTLPNGHRVAIAIYTSGIADPKQRGAIIAQSARAMYDQWSAP